MTWALSVGESWFNFPYMWQNGDDNFQRSGTVSHNIGFIVENRVIWIYDFFVCTPI